MLGSILAYLRFNFSGYALSLVLFAAALLSKTIACSTPAVILLLLWWKRKLSWKEAALLAPMFIAGAVLARVTVQMEVQHVGASGPEWEFSLAQRFIIAGKAIWFYVAKLLWPAQLTFSYPRWAIDPRDPWQWLPPAALILVVAALALAVARDRVGRGVLVAVLIFIGTLFPALGFFNTYPMRYSFVADHFVYISSIAFIALVIAAIATAFEYWLQRPRIDAIRARFAVANGALLLVILGVLTFRQALIYHDSQTLWRDTIQKNPDSWMARNNLAVLLTHSGAADLGAGRDAEGRRKLEEALRLLEDAEESHPEPRKVRFNRAEALVKLGRYDEAMQVYERELTSHPHDPRIITQIGNVLAQMNRLDAAEQRFRRAIELDNRLIEPRLNLAKLLEQRERFDDAIEQYERVLRIRPNDPPAHLELGLLLYRPQINRLEEAALHLERYVELMPHDPDARATLGFVYGELSRYREAREQFARALELDPNHAAAQRGTQLLRRPTTATGPAPATEPAR
jgi:tetratricopeptide (TPR) repeat protein